MEAHQHTLIYRPMTSDDPHPHYAEASDGHVLEEQLFFLHQATPNTDLHVVFGGYERCAPDFEIQRHSYPFYVLEYPLSGSCSLEINQQTYALKPGRISGFSPSCAHHYRADPQDPLEHLFICFTGTQAEALFQQSILARTPTFNCDESTDIDQLFRGLIRKGRSNSNQRSEMCQHYLRLLLLELSDDSKATQALSRSQQSYLDCKQFIDLHFPWLSSSQEIATHCHMTARHLSRLFKQHSTCTPQAYLMQLKMNKASVLLRASQASIQSIASTVGFEDPYHFSRNFKKMYQISPKAYRNKS